MYHLQTMGRLAISEGRSAPEPLLADQKPLLLVAYLALTPGHKARRDHVAELFWPGNGHSTSRRGLGREVQEWIEIPRNRPLSGPAGPLHPRDEPLRIVSVRAQGMTVVPDPSFIVASVP